LQFLAPEKLRGVGGILLRKQDGRRLVNELATRDVVAKVRGGPSLASTGSSSWQWLAALPVQTNATPVACEVVPNNRDALLVAACFRFPCSASRPL
jgi:hypothetical protein